MTSDELFERIKADAIVLNQIDPYGALHIFVSDGNCEDEHLDLCLKDPRITDEERAWIRHMLASFTEEQRYAVWAFADCVDLQG